MLIEILKVLLLGIVEGFSEWLPISSTGHMILVDALIQLKVDEAFRELFMVVIQLGAILAVVVLYFHKLNPFSPTKRRGQRRRTLQLWGKIIIACIPAAVIGLPLDNYMDKIMNPWVVAAMLILYGIFFLLLERRNAYASFPIRKTDQISFRAALIIGFSQVLAMIPGTSRSGATILCAMLLGCSRSVSAEFSFFLGIPVMFGASLLKVVKFFVRGDMFTGPEFIYLLLGMAAAFLVSLFSIHFLMDYVKRHDFTIFGWYRIVLGVIVFAFFAVQALAG